MSTTLIPRPEINASNADTQRNGPSKVDQPYPSTKGPYTILTPKERARYFQILAADATQRPAFEKRDVSKLASCMTLSSTEKLPNDTAPLNAKPWSRDRPSLPSTSISGMLPLIDFKEKPDDDDAKKVESAAVVRQNHRLSDIRGQTDVHHESVDTPAAPLGGVIGSRNNHAESSNQAGARDIPRAKLVGYRAAPGRASPPETTNLSTNLPRTSDLAREMQARQENTNRLFHESLSQQKGNRSDKPIPSDLPRNRQAHRDALRSSREKTNRLLHDNLSQQKDNLDVANKSSSHHSPDLATKEPTRQPLPETPVLRPTQEQSKVASATLPYQQHQTQEADSETQLGKLPSLQSSASNVQRPSKAALLEYQIQLHNLEHQAYLHGFGTWHEGSYRPNYTLSDEEMEMIYTFTRKLSTRGTSAEPQNLQEELTMPHKLHMAQKGPQKIVVTEGKRELQNAMVGDQHKQYGQARSTKISSPLVSLSGGLQDIHATWSEPEVVKTIPVDSHCSQKKAPVDGSYLAEEERKVLDHVRGSMSTNFSVTNTGGNLEPANTSVEDLQKLNDFPIVRECMACHVGCSNVGFSQGPAREAAQIHKATQTSPGRLTDCVKARSWNTTNMEASRIAEERAIVFHATYEEKREQMIKEGPRSLRDFQRAVGSTESTTNLLATSHPFFTADSCSNSAEKKPTATKALRSVTEKGEKYETDLSPKETEAENGGGSFELARTLHLDFSPKRAEAENGSGSLELAENLDGSTSNLRSFDHMKQSQGYHQLLYNRYMLGGSEPQAINEPRAVKAAFNEAGDDTVLSKAKYIVEREGPRMGYRNQDLEDITSGSSLRRPEYTSAKTNPPTTDSTPSKSQSWFEARAVKIEKLMSDFWSQPRNMTAHKGPDSGSSPMTARPALYNLPTTPSTPEAEMGFDIGGPDIDNWRMLVDFESKAPSAAALAAAKEKLTFNREPILGSAPVKQEDTKPTSLPVLARGVAYDPLAATTPSSKARTTSLSPNAEARSAAVSTAVIVAKDEDEEDEGEQDDWTVLDSDNSSRRHSFVDSNEMLEATPSEASDSSSMDVEVGDDRSEVNENEWIIC